MHITLSYKFKSLLGRGRANLAEACSVRPPRLVLSQYHRHRTAKEYANDVSMPRLARREPKEGQ
jgi:hypothetical protein